MKLLTTKNEILQKYRLEKQYLNGTKEKSVFLNKTDDEVFNILNNIFKKYPNLRSEYSKWLLRTFISKYIKQITEFLDTEVKKPDLEKIKKAVESGDSKEIPHIGTYFVTVNHKDGIVKTEFTDKTAEEIFEKAQKEVKNDKSENSTIIKEKKTHKKRTLETKLKELEERESQYIPLSEEEINNLEIHPNVDPNVEEITTTYDLKESKNKKKKKIKKLDETLNG